MTMTTLMTDPAALAAIEAMAAQDSNDWHVFESDDRSIYILGGVWGTKETSSEWGQKRFAHVEVAGESLPGSALADKVSEWSGTDAAEAFPWTESHFQSSKGDPFHRTFLVLYRVPAGPPVRLKQGYRGGKYGWGKDETRYLHCDPATYHGYLRATQAFRTRQSEAAGTGEEAPLESVASEPGGDDGYVTVV